MRRVGGEAAPGDEPLTFEIRIEPDMFYTYDGALRPIVPEWQ